MKILLGLCALLFAGQSMAVCSPATVQGSYLGPTTGNLTAAAPFAEIASASIDGLGGAKAQFFYNLSGVSFSSVQTATYTVTTALDGSGNCVLDFSAILFGILPVQFKGISPPSGNVIYTLSTTPGTTLSGTLTRVP